MDFWAQKEIKEHFQQDIKDDTPHKLSGMAE